MTIPKGVVGGLEFTVLNRNLREWQERTWTYVCECWKESNKLGLTATVSGTANWSYPILAFGIVACTLSAAPNVNFRKIGSLSSDVLERRTSTGSEVFSLLTCLDDIKFVFLSFFTVIEAIWLKICAKLPSKNEKRPLPVNVRRSKTLLLKLPNVSF